MRNTVMRVCCILCAVCAFAVRVCVCVRACVHVRALVHVCTRGACVCVWGRAYTHTSTRTRKLTRKLAHKLAHKYTHLHMHKYTQFNLDETWLNFSAITNNCSLCCKKARGTAQQGGKDVSYIHIFCLISQETNGSYTTAISTTLITLLFNNLFYFRQNVLLRAC